MVLESQEKETEKYTWLNCPHCTKPMKEIEPEIYSCKDCNSVWDISLLKEEKSESV